MSTTQLRHGALPVGVNSTVRLTGNSIGGFLCVVSGTVTVVNGAGATIVAAFPVTAGNWYWMPFLVGPNGGTFTTAGGASGTVAV